MDLKTLLSSSDFDKVNTALHELVPFNKAHDINVVKITSNSVEASIPYERNNFNHVNGIHACALATLAEYVSGLLMLVKFDVKKYRLIMAKLEVEYLYQAKMDCVAKFNLNSDETDKILHDLTKYDKVIYPAKVDVIDLDKNIICSAIITWQIKSWEKVKSK